MTVTKPAAPVLAEENLSAGYGHRCVIESVSLTAALGEIVAVIGPNGSGKSTLLKAVCGHIRVFGGVVRFNGDDVTRVPPHQKTARGVVYLPQGNRVFDDLSMLENLQMGATSSRSRRRRGGSTGC